MKSFFADKKNIVIVIMAIIILIFGFALIADETVSPNMSPNVLKLQEKREQEVAGLQTNPSVVPSAAPDKQIATLVKVIDGDTITVSVKGKNEVLRIIGIDTPELVDTRKTVECFAREASKMAKAMFENKKTLYLESDPTQEDRDKYQRLLRYVWIDSGGVDFGKFMIDSGFASEYTYNLPYKYRNVYKEAERKAREEKIGLWADDVCVTNTETVRNEVEQTLPTTQKDATMNVRGGDKDCSDFATQQEAQTYFESKGGSSTNNVDRLDVDRDGIACESLP